MPEALTGFDLVQAANLGIEPIEPGETFQLTREIRGWEAKQILAMHPKGSHRWEMPRIKLEMPRITRKGLRNISEILTEATLSAIGGALGGALAGGMGVGFFTAVSIPRMVITGEFPPQPTTADIEAIKLVISCLAGSGALFCSSLATWGAIESPYNRTFRFNS